MDVVGLVLGLAALVATVALLAIDETWPRFDDSRRRLLTGLVGAGMAAVVCGYVAAMVMNIAGEREWDFLGFWVPAAAAAEGADFYDPAALARVDLPFAVGEAFRLEVVDAGFAYPPPTMLWLAPFGALDYRVAFGVWSVIQLVGLGFSAWLVFRLVRGLDRAGASAGGDGSAGSGRGGDPRRAVTLTAIVVTTVPSLVNVLNAQTNFWLLALVLVAIGAPSPSTASPSGPAGSLSGARGAALGMAVLIKPYLVVLLLVGLVWRRYVWVAGAVGVWAAAAVATMTIWGLGVFGSFVDRLDAFPDHVYDQVQNQSWAGLGSRHVWGGRDPMDEPVFWFGVGAVLVVAGVAVVVNHRAGLDGGVPTLEVWSLMVTTGLIV